MKTGSKRSATLCGMKWTGLLTMYRFSIRLYLLDAGDPVIGLSKANSRI